MNAIETWIASKPGPFTGRTPDSVWTLAWRNFNEGPTGGINNELGFMMAVGDAGVEVRPTTLGGYILDTKP